MVAVSASTALVLVVAEFGLRLIYPSRVARSVDLSRISFEFNDSYLVALKKSWPKESPGEAAPRWRSNRDGFRGSELRRADSRVMVYGDSNVMARFSATDDTFTGQLANRLGSALSRDVEVINAGVVGFGPDQSLLKLQDEIDRYQPDLVVLHIFADNDFGDLIRNRLFELDDRGRLVETRHPRHPDPHFSGESPFWSSLLIVRAVRKLLDPYWNASRLRSEFEVYRSGGEQVFSHFADLYDTDLALYPDSPSARAKRMLMDAVLQRAGQLAEERGVELMVVVQPATFDLTTNLSPNFKDFSAVESYRPSNLTRFATESAEKAGLPVVSLFEPFRQNDPAQLYFPESDNHWNDRGQALAAREVASFILERELL